MKEHPDYKYRPRRKPKSLLKKEPKFGFSLLSHHPGDLHRSLLHSAPPPVPPPLPGAGADSPFARPLLSPFHYPLYSLPPAKLDDAGKATFEMAMQALYSSHVYSHASAVAAAAAASWPGHAPCGCPPTAPSPPPTPGAGDGGGIKRPVACLLVKPEDHYAAQHVI